LSKAIFKMKGENGKMKADENGGIGNEELGNHSLSLLKILWHILSGKRETFRL